MLSVLAQFICVLFIHLARVNALETNGLSVLLAPAAHSEQHAGSDLVIAIDISNNGQVLPSSTLDSQVEVETEIESLELYFISKKASQNFTISKGSTLLSQESGSTVKHLSWRIPVCAYPGECFLSIYEHDCLGNVTQFSVTEIPLIVLNTAHESDCGDVEQNPYTGTPTRPNRPKEPPSSSDPPSLTHTALEPSGNPRGGSPIYNMPTPPPEPPEPLSPTPSDSPPIRSEVKVPPPEESVPAVILTNTTPPPINTPSPPMPQPKIDDPVITTTGTQPQTMPVGPSAELDEQSRTRTGQVKNGLPVPTPGEGGTLKTATSDGTVSSFIPINRAGTSRPALFNCFSSRSFVVIFALIVYIEVI